MKKLKIVCANNNHAERQYIFDVLLSDFLGLDFEIEFKDNWSTYDILCPNKTISFNDAFFAYEDRELLYLRSSKIPKNVSVFNSPINKNPLPIIYGHNEFYENNNKIWQEIM